MYQKKQYEGFTGEQFFEKYNKPFLDMAMNRGDLFPLATRPNHDNVYNDGLYTGFGREIDYLTSKGYFYDSEISSMN